MQIQYTGNLSRVNGVKCLGYGRSGVGKTRLGLTAPRPFYLSAESGLLSIRRENMPYLVINSMAQLGEAHAWVMKSAEAKKFDTVILDSVSDIAEVLLFEEGQKSKDPRKLYPEYQSKMLDMMRDFRDMPQKHVYFIAKEGIVDGADQVKIAGPSFPGKILPANAPFFFDQVFRVVAWQDPANPNAPPQIGLKCRADFSSEGKDRSGALSLWEPPDLSAMFRKIMAS